MERFINGFLDLITIWFLSRLEKAMHLFGAMGSNVYNWTDISSILNFKIIPHV
jgi:hypothetical protein